MRHEYSDALKGQTHDAFAKEILAQPLKYPVGQDYRYSCSGMVLLGFILEKVHGDTLENLFEKYIKARLELTRSKFNIEIDELNAAICYRSEGLEGLQHPWDDENIRVLQTAAGRTVFHAAGYQEVHRCSTGKG